MFSKETVIEWNWEHHFKMKHINDIDFYSIFSLFVLHPMRRSYSTFAHRCFKKSKMEAFHFIWSYPLTPERREMSRESNPGWLCINQARYPSRQCLSGSIFQLNLFLTGPISRQRHFGWSRLHVGDAEAADQEFFRRLANASGSGQSSLLPAWPAATRRTDQHVGHAGQCRQVLRHFMTGGIEILFYAQKENCVI